MVGYQVILAELGEALDGRQLAFPEAVSASADLLRAQARVAPVLNGRVPLADRASTRIRQGLPALELESWPVDGDALRILGTEICRIAAGHRPDLAPPLEAVGAWLQEEGKSMAGTATEFLRSGRVARAEEKSLPGDLVAFVLNNALHPFLRAQAESLAPVIAQGTWDSGQCPVCGGEPDLAALDRQGNARRLLCSHCDYEWLYRWTGCPFCGDGAQSSYYLSEDEAYRLYECHACHRYLKTVDVRRMTRERSLPAERVLTVAMDVAVRQSDSGEA